MISRTSNVIFILHRRKPRFREVIRQYSRYSGSKWQSQLTLHALVSPLDYTMLYPRIWKGLLHLLLVSWEPSLPWNCYIRRSTDSDRHTNCHIYMMVAFLKFSFYEMGHVCWPFNAAVCKTVLYASPFSIFFLCVFTKYKLTGFKNGKWKECSIQEQV